MESFRIRYLDGNRIPSIELVCEFTGIGLRAAKEIVETRGVILERTTAAEARRIHARFAANGVQVEIERNWRHVYAYDPRHAARGDQVIQRLRAGRRELEVAVDRGKLGLWDSPEVGSIVDTHTERFTDPRLADGFTVEQLQRWERAGLAVAQRELEVLEALSAREPELEARLRADPRDADAHLIYGDWLQARGDARGQLIALQHGCERARGPERAELREREQSFRREHASHLFGPLRQAIDAVAVRWSLGFIDEAFVGQTSWSRSLGGPFELLAGLLRLPVAARLIELGLTNALVRRPELAELLAGSEVVANLRALSLGDHVEPAGRRSPTPGDFRDLWPRLRRLRRLAVHGARPPLAGLASPTLEHLELHLRAIPHDLPDRIASAELPELKVLTLSVSRAEALVRSDLDRLLAAPSLARLTCFELQLPNDPCPLALAEHLLRQPRIAALDCLDLSRCALEPRARETLSVARERGRGPREIRLSGR